MAPAAQARIEKKNMVCTECGFQNPTDPAKQIFLAPTKINMNMAIVCQGMNETCLEPIRPYEQWMSQMDQERQKLYEQKYGPLDKKGQPIDDTPLYKGAGYMGLGFVIYIIPIPLFLFALEAGETELVAALFAMGVFWLLYKIFFRD